jgi:hypothetical protein
MNNCIGIDVGKQELVVFDGKNHRIFPNDEHLSQLHNYIKSRGKDVKIIFEPTSTYSRRLEELCITNSILFKKVNPSIVPNLRRVENIRSKTDLAGLDPIQHHSGSSVHGKPRISKQGSSLIRKILYQATLSAARYNPYIRKHYENLKKSGKPDKLARTAAARKDSCVHIIV